MKFYAELLIFILLFLTNVRILFTREARRDALVNLAPVSFILSILMIIAWHADVFTILCCLLSFIVLLSNFHALLRYSAHLYIDHYTPLMKFWAHFTNVLSIAALIFTIIYMPVDQHPKNIKSSEKIYKYQGSFKSGFEPSRPFSISNCYIHEFNKYVDVKDHDDVENTSDEIILFFPDKRGDTNCYKPFLQYLASENYTVYSVDFYSTDCKWLHSVWDGKPFRRFALVLQSVFNNKKFMAQREFYTFNSTLEVNAVFNLLEENFNLNKKVFIVSDVMANTAIEDFYAQNSDKIAGIYNFDSILQYETKGYGCVEQTDPLLATKLGLKRDNKNIVPKVLAQQTSKNAKIAFNTFNNSDSGETNDTDRTE